MILFICANDGSDTRVVKEIATLNKRYKIFYLGIGVKSNTSFSLEEVEEYLLIPGSHKSIKTLIVLCWNLIKILFKYKFKKIHVVDEQLYFFLFPFLIKQKVILDIFDSYFLKLNFPKNKLYLLKMIIYGFPYKLIVTDENRYDLLPNFAKKKTIIIPNMPNFYNYEKKKITNKFLTICYFGSLNKERGTVFLENLLVHDNDIQIIAAGWITDEYTKLFIKNSRVKYLGVRKQREINTILANEGDYLLSIYPVNNTNNIYASPNKIFDAIQTYTPVIINREIIVSNFVVENNVGYVLENIENLDYNKLIFDLKKMKNTYNFSQNLVKKYSWEVNEFNLINI